MKVRNTLVWTLMLSAVLLCGCKSFPPSNFPAEFSTPPEATQLMPGDEIEIAFLGAADLNTTQVIRRDGGITLKLLGDVQAAGRTPQQLQKELIGRYTPQLQVKELSITLKSPPPVFVSGAVRAPGRVDMKFPITVLDAIMLAGGFDEEWAEIRQVFVIRNENGTHRTYAVNFGGLLKGGAKVRAFYLKPFDTVYVSRLSSPRSAPGGKPPIAATPWMLGLGG